LTGHTTKAHIDTESSTERGKYFLGLGVPKNTAFWFFCANIKNAFLQSFFRKSVSVAWRRRRPGARSAPSTVLVNINTKLQILFLENKLHSTHSLTPKIHSTKKEEKNSKELI
jgi:hypothetical protein